MLDLHTHSRASDGSDAPGELVRLALDSGLGGLALTDHDTVSGLPEFMAAAHGQKIIAVPGVELSSCLHSREIHLLGLFIDPDSETLSSLLRAVRAGRSRRNRAMVEKLKAMGYRLTEEALRDCAHGESVGRPHLAQLLIREGYFATVAEAFEHCLKRGARAYVPRDLPPPEESIRAIHAAGGLAFWAHPVARHVRGECSAVRRFLRLLVPLGLDGIEAFYPGYTKAQTGMLTESARECGLLRSGGSDYHGINHPEIRLGIGDGSLNVPDELLDRMKEKLR